MFELVLFLFHFLYSQLFVRLPEPTHDFTGQTVIVVGANVGLGLEATRHLARLNAAKVIMAVRSIERGEAAKRDVAASLSQAKGSSSTDLQVWQLDLSDPASVLAFARRVNDELPLLDTLLLNASIVPGKFETRKDGTELTIATNVIGTFLLAILLLPRLRATAKKRGVPSHCTIVASEVHHFTQLPARNQPEIFKALNVVDEEEVADRYNVSKLMQVFLAREMAGKMNVDEVIVNCVNPGLCATNILRNQNDSQKSVVQFLVGIVGRTAEVGSRTLLHAISAPKDTHGSYLSDCKIKNPAAFVDSEEGKRTQERLWKELSVILEGIRPGVLKNLEA
ncbi:NAD(P)-binding protein [Chytriomyces sp. MP71]|nr:NAD(P)-binding protein [Chytriomyces sp. MP71]